MRPVMLSTPNENLFSVAFSAVEDHSGAEDTDTAKGDIINDDITNDDVINDDRPPLRRFRWGYLWVCITICVA